MRRVLVVTFFLPVILLTVGYVVYNAWAWQRAADVVDSGFRELGSAPTNEHPGAIFLDNDAYYWMGYARRMGNGETWRVRYTFADNAPYGRPVHWSQSISWLLVLSGRARQCISGEPWTIAMERASIWINPTLMICLITALGFAIWRRMGPIPAGLFPIYLVTLGDVVWTFQPLRPGHQSLYCAFGIMALAGLVFGGAGWIRNELQNADSRLVRPLEIPDLRVARRWFLVSGLATALNLWVSAVITSMLLIMLLGAAALLAFRAPALETNVQVKPELWRWWGWIASAVSFAFFLLEYFPSHLSLLRLEVNGPLYSLAVLALGEAVCQFLRARYQEPAKAKWSLVKGAACTVVFALLPLAIFCGSPDWHALRDPQMMRLHNFIQEFYSLPRFAGPRLASIVAEDFGIVPLFLILAILVAAFARLRLVEWAVVWLSFAVALGMLGLGYLQIRWLGLYSAMNAWLALVAGVSFWRVLQERLTKSWQKIVGSVLLSLLLIQPILFAKRSIKQVNENIARRTVLKELSNPALNKRLALAFRAREGPGTRVMSDPDFVPALQYFGDGSGVVSFYWENLAGLHAAAQFFADANSETARRIATERGLTHVIVQEGNRLQTTFYYIANGKIDQLAGKETLAARLMESEFELPRWLQWTPALQQIGMQLYTYSGMNFEERWRIYRITQDPTKGALIDRATLTGKAANGH